MLYKELKRVLITIKPPEGQIMMRQRSIELECPKCDAKQSVSLYDSINVSIDPNLKEKLFNGEINVFHCEKCDQKIFIPNPLLYHDMEKHLLVQFYPFEAIEDREFLKQFTREGEYSSALINMVPRKLREPYKRIHLVFDMEELIRFVIFREKLNELWAEPS
jgi:hypothetical protein